MIKINYENHFTIAIVLKIELENIKQTLNPKKPDWSKNTLELDPKSVSQE